MPLVHLQRRIMPPSPIPTPKRAYSNPVSSHRRARLACDLAAAGADGTGAMVKSHRGAEADRSGNRPGVRSRVAGSRGILGRTGDRGSLLRPARRRLMGLGDKTATARRPELAGQLSARSVIPFVETVLHITELRAKARRSAQPSTNFAAIARRRRRVSSRLPDRQGGATMTPHPIA